MTVGIAASAAYLPERWMTAAEISDASGIPEQVLVEKFGLRGKHIAAEDEHVSDLCASSRGVVCSDESGIDPAEIDAVVYFGSMWRDYAVWQAAPWIAHRLGCVNALALEYANVSCGGPMALRLARNYLVGDDGLRSLLARRRLAGVVPPRLRERALAVHVQLRRRRGGDAPAARRAGQRAARLARDHGRLALASGEGALGRQRRHERRLPVPRRRRPVGDEGAARRGQPAELRPCSGRRARALGGDARRRLVPLRAAHEALDARRARPNARGRPVDGPCTSTTRGT